MDPRGDAADNLDDDVLHAELCAYVVPRTISKPRLDVADRDGSLSLAKSSSTQALRDFSATRRVTEDRKAAQIREYKRRQSKKRIQENQAKRRIRGSIKASRDDDDDGAAPPPVYEDQNDEWTISSDGSKLSTKPSMVSFADATPTAAADEPAAAAAAAAEPAAAAAAPLAVDTSPEQPTTDRVPSPVARAASPVASAAAAPAAAPAAPAAAPAAAPSAAAAAAPAPVAAAEPPAAAPAPAAAAVTAAPATAAAPPPAAAAPVSAVPVVREPRDQRASRASRDAPDAAKRRPSVAEPGGGDGSPGRANMRRASISAKRTPAAMLAEKKRKSRGSRGYADDDADEDGPVIQPVVQVRKVDERRAMLHRGRKDRGKGVALSKKDRAQIGRVKKALNPEAEALESAGPQSSAITDMAALNTKLEQRCAKIHRIREFQESHEGELDIWDDD